MSANKHTNKAALKADITEPSKILNSEVSGENDLKMQNESENKGVAEAPVAKGENLEAEFDEALHEELVEEGKEEDTLHELHLRLARNHKHMRFPLGSTVIEGREFKPYQLTNAQMEELFTAGPMHWLEAEEGTLEELKAKFKA